MPDLHYENEKKIFERNDYGDGLTLLRIPIILSMSEESKTKVCL